MIHNIEFEGIAYIKVDGISCEVIHSYNDDKYFIYLADVCIAEFVTFGECIKYLEERSNKNDD